MKTYTKIFVRTSILFISILTLTNGSWADTTNGTEHMPVIPGTETTIPGADTKPAKVTICVDRDSLPAAPKLSLVNTYPTLSLSIKQTEPQLSPEPLKNFHLSRESEHNCYKIELDSNIIDLNAPANSKTKHLIMENSTSPIGEVSINNLKDCADQTINVSLKSDTTTGYAAQITPDVINCPQQNVK